MFFIIQYIYYFGIADAIIFKDCAIEVVFSLIWVRIRKVSSLISKGLFEFLLFAFSVTLWRFLLTALGPHAWEVLGV